MILKSSSNDDKLESSPLIIYILETNPIIKLSNLIYIIHSLSLLPFKLGSKYIDPVSRKLLFIKSLFDRKPHILSKKSGIVSDESDKFFVRNAIERLSKSIDTFVKSNAIGSASLCSLQHGFLRSKAAKYFLEASGKDSYRVFKPAG
jgi:hypothetical protein